MENPSEPERFNSLPEILLVRRLVTQQCTRLHPFVLYMDQFIERIGWSGEVPEHTIGRAGKEITRQVLEARAEVGDYSWDQAQAAQMLAMYLHPSNT